MQVNQGLRSRGDQIVFAQERREMKSRDEVYAPASKCTLNQLNQLNILHILNILNTLDTLNILN